MIEINLLPQELRKKEASKLVIPNIFNRQFIVTVGAIFLTAHLLLGGLAVYQSIELGSTQRQVTVLKQSTKETALYKTEIQAVKEHVAQVDQLTRRSFSWAKLINILSNSTPKGLWLRSFVVVEETRAVANVVDTEKTPKEVAGVKKAGKTVKGSKAPKAPKSPKASKRAAVDTEQKVSVLKLKGSVVSSGQETATIGHFIKALKEDVYFASIFDEVEFFDIAQRKIKSFDVYDFTITCDFKKDKF